MPEVRLGIAETQRQQAGRSSYPYAEARPQADRSRPSAPDGHPFPPRRSMSRSAGQRSPNCAAGRNPAQPGARCSGPGISRCRANYTSSCRTAMRSLRGTRPGQLIANGPPADALADAKVWRFHSSARPPMLEVSRVSVWRYGGSKRCATVSIIGQRQPGPRNPRRQWGQDRSTLLRALQRYSRDRPPAPLRWKTGTISGLGLKRSLLRSALARTCRRAGGIFPI